jgi:hypothetical protein
MCLSRLKRQFIPFWKSKTRRPEDPVEDHYISSGHWAPLGLTSEPLRRAARCAAPRVLKDHGVARGAGTGRRVGAGALDVRANPTPPPCGAYGVARNARRERKRGVVAAAALAPWVFI